MAAHGPKQTRPVRDGSRALMCDKDFARFSEFIHHECGIKLTPAKKTMLEARLQKRLRLLDLEDFSAYCEYLFDPAGMAQELFHLIDAVTTNTTDFFREPRHFEYLSQTMLPQWQARHGERREFRIWSAGCSTGMEPYTMAMVLSEFASRNPGFRFSILATDISTQVLDRARQGVYTDDQAQAVPDLFKRRYFLRSKDRSRALVRVVPELRRSVSFQRLNFMEEFSVKEPMDVIFCRNVIIYFDRATQDRLLSRLCGCLRPEGHFFIGHSESLASLDLPLRQAAPTIYCKSGEGKRP